MSGPNPVDVFQAEAQELLEQIEGGLLDLEQNPEEEEIIAAVFRALHTLKGSGAMFGFSALAEFAHHCESAFDRVRKGEVKATPPLISAVLSAMDHLRALAGGNQADAAEDARLLGLLNEAMGNAGVKETATVPQTPTASQMETKETSWHIRFSLPPEILINGTRPLSLLDELREIGETKIAAIVDTIPPLAELNPTECLITWDVQLTTQQPRSAIDDVFIFVMDDMTLQIEEISAPTLTCPVVQTSLPPTANATPPAPAKEPVASERNETKTGKAVGSIRVPADRLDELMDRVAELVIAQSRLKQVSASSTDINLRAVSEEIERLASELRDSMMFVRMVPIAQLFGRFRRLTHDLARDMGKAIELQTEGETTELDKTVIERLADPMIHLIRNSIDHGLEMPRDRLAAGKSEAGHILLSARQAGAEVIITVADDGRGIDRDRVKTKAVEKGLIPQNANLSDKELFQLLFAPGFSTAAKVTSLSGRGVGMDVVKRTIESLRGAIDLSSEVGSGTRIDLRIPLTLAIIDGLLIRVGAQRYVIPLAAVEECVELTPEQDARSTGRNFLTLRDALVPFIRLRELFASNTEPDRYQKIVVVATGTERVGLVVDQIVGQHQTVIKPMSRFHADVETFSGATILGDGSVALILDIAHLVAAGQQMEERLRAAS